MLTIETERVVKRAIEHLGEVGCLAVIEEMKARAIFDQDGTTEEYMAGVADRFKTWFGEDLRTDSPENFVAMLLVKGVLATIR